MKTLKEFENKDLLKILEETVINEITARYNKGRRECRKNKEEILNELSDRDIDTFGLEDDIIEKFFHENNDVGDQNKDESWIPAKNSKSRIMYIEYKGDSLIGSGRIGRFNFSKSGKSLYYKGKSFQSLGGDGYKANYFDTETGERYWISGCKKNGNDSLYPSVIEIDEDVREEYWKDIRESLDHIKKTSYRSEGKHSKRKPK